jgi:hypothetical protein
MIVTVAASRTRFRLKLSAGLAFCVSLVALSVVVGRHLTGTTWPLQDTNVGLVSAVVGVGWSLLYTLQRRRFAGAAGS